MGDGTPLDVALDYIRRGWSPVPIPYRKKGPVLEGWPKLRITAADAGTYFNGAPGNVGVLLGSPSSGLVDIDLDCHEAIAVAPYLLPRTGAIFGRAQAEGSHWLYCVAADAGSIGHAFKDPEPGEAKGMLVEIRHDGHQTVFPGSTHQDTGETIAWARGHSGTPDRIEAEDLQRRVRRVAAAAVLVRALPGHGDGRHLFLCDVACLLARASYAEVDRVPFLEAICQAGGIPDAGKVARNVARVDEKNRLSGFPKLVALIGDKRAKAVADWIGYTDAPRAAGFTISEPGAIPWVPGRGGKPSFCTENACLALEHMDDWRGVLAFDEFNQITMLLKPVPGSPVPRSTFRARELAEHDFTHAQRWFNRHGFPDATSDGVARALLSVARHTIISPVRFYLEDLKWDGTERLGSWLQVYAGAADTGLVRAAARAWAISAVARALEPGCKADCALILEGPQGVGKSTLLRTLAGPDWFTDAVRDLVGKDASAALRGRWIIELPELAAMRRADVEAAKAFLSRDVERYRPSYGRVEVAEPRRCVFAGTTNRTDWHRDDTGGRRFWPVAVGPIDVPALQLDRDQLWAEAVAAYRAGEQWWLTGGVEQEAAAEVALRSEDDPWTSAVLSFAVGSAEISTADVLTKLGFLPADMGKAESMRVAGLLVRNGWRRDGKFGGGINKGLARYVPCAGGARER